MFKNVSGQKIAFYAFDTSANAPKTGDAANITAYVSKDGGAVTVLADTSAAEADNTNAKGIYFFDVAQGESNGDLLVFSAKSSTANIQIDPLIIMTTPANFNALGIGSNGHVTNVDTAVFVTNDVGISQAGADKVWGSAARTLTSFGTLVADVATAVWAAAARTLTAFGTLAADVWASGTRTLTQTVGDATAANQSTINNNVLAIGIPPTAAGIDTQLSGTHGSGAWGSVGSGTGARTVTVTVTDGTSPLQNARVRFTEGSNTFTSLTNVSGVASFSLDDATYSLAITKSGYSFTPTTQAISADVALSKTMTAISIPAPSDPVQSTAYLTTYDTQGIAEASIPITFHLLAVPAGTTAGAYSDESLTVTSDMSGLLQVALIRGATYRAQREGGRFHRFVVSDASTYALPSLLGHAN